MPETQPVSFNQPIIDEFRANGGVVGGMFEGAPLLLLTTTGARSGARRTSPVMYLRDGDRLLIFGSNAGGPAHPDWFHNLLADPQVSYEIGEEGEDGAIRSYAATAAPLEGEERDRWYGTQAELVPAFRDYQANTSRTIPVVALHTFRLDPDPERNRAIGAHLLQVHNELRAELAKVRTEIENALTGEVPPDRPAAELRDELFEHCLTACQNMRLHHRGEDWAFRAMRNGFPDLAETLDRLRAEHDTVHRTLDEIRALIGRVREGTDQLDEIRVEFERLTGSLEEHFAYEEKHLIPALETVPVQ